MSNNVIHLINRYSLYISIVCLTLISNLSVGQINQGGMPYSLSFNANSRIESLLSTKKVFSSIDNEIEKDRAKILKEECSTCRSSYYGTGIPTSINIKDDGQKYDIGTGHLYKIEVTSEEAYGLQFYFDKYKLPPGSTLFIYNNKKQVLGAFTSRNNHPDEKFATQLISGESATLEYFEPHDADFDGQLSVYKVIHSFVDYDKIKVNQRSSPDTGFGESWSCHIDIGCREGYEDIMNSVARIAYYDAKSNLCGHCSGFLVNSTDPARPAFFLTADHCLGGDNSPMNLRMHRFHEWIIEFDYENNGCVLPIEPTSFISTNGARLLTRSKFRDEDYALFDLEVSNFADYYGVPYLGFSISPNPPSGAFGMHHPNGDVKKISFTNAITNWNSGGTRWEVDWNEGITQGGSSGSPLINDVNNRVIGLLSTGGSNCDSDLPDFYTQFHEMWNKKDDRFNYPLRHFLDYNNENISTLDPYIPDNVGGNPDDGNPRPTRCIPFEAQSNIPYLGTPISKLGFDVNNCESKYLLCQDEAPLCQEWTTTHGEHIYFCDKSAEFNNYGQPQDGVYSKGIIRNYSFEAGREYILSYRLWGSPYQFGNSTTWKFYTKSENWNIDLGNNDCGYYRVKKIDVNYSEDGLISKISRVSPNDYNWKTYASRFTLNENKSKLLIVNEMDHHRPSYIKDLMIFDAEFFDGGDCDNNLTLNNTQLLGNVYAKRTVTASNTTIANNGKIQAPHIILKNGFKVSAGKNFITNGNRCNISDNPNSATVITTLSSDPDIIDIRGGFLRTEGQMENSLYTVREFNLYSETVNDVALNSFITYPNPTSEGKIFVKQESPLPWSYEIFNLAGSSLYKSGVKHESDNTILLNSYSGQVLIIRIADMNGNSTTQKVIIK